MEQMLICLSIALIAGLLMSRLAKAVNLPAVTSYLVAGLLLGPFVLGRLGLSGLGIGFGSLEQVEGYGVVTQVALGFIAFVIGNEFRLSSLRSMGQQAITVGIAQAVITTALVDVALVGVHLLFPQVLSLASAITLGSIAAATAPAATLMVVKQYKAKGPLTHLLLMVVAIDDAVGLVLFSASYGVANALEQGHMDLLSVVVEPLMEILLSLLLGAVAGYLLNLLEVYFHSRSKRMSLSVAFVLLTVGVSHQHPVLRAVRRRAGPDHPVQSSGAAGGRGVHRQPLPGQDQRCLCQLPCHQVQPQHPEIPGHHPAAPGWRSPGHGRRGCPAFRRTHGPERGAVLGAGV